MPRGALLDGETVTCTGRPAIGSLPNTGAIGVLHTGFTGIGHVQVPAQQL